IVMLRRVQIMKGNLTPQALSTLYAIITPLSGEHAVLIALQDFRSSGCDHRHDVHQALRVDFRLLLPRRCYLLVRVFNSASHTSTQSKTSYNDDSSVFIPTLFSMNEIPALFSQRPIVHRHELAGMYHPMVEAIAMTLVDVPFTFVTIVLFSVIIYFVVQLQQTA